MLWQRRDILGGHAFLIKSIVLNLSNVVLYIVRLCLPSSKMMRIRPRPTLDATQTGGKDKLTRLPDSWDVRLGYEQQHVLRCFNKSKNTHASWAARGHAVAGTILDYVASRESAMHGIFLSYFVIQQSCELRVLEMQSMLRVEAGRPPLTGVIGYKT